MHGSDGPPSYTPTPGLSYDPAETKYWDENLLNGEIQRVFEICKGCRMCFKYCDSFPTLFSFLDENHDGDTTKLEEQEIHQVMDACFHCKLCEVQCPYTPRDNHAFQLNFPGLVSRYRALEAKKKGFSLRDRILGNPDLAGAMARLSLGMANFFNNVKIFRYVLEKILGIHRKKLLPIFASTPFEKWAAKMGRIKTSPGSEAVLFQTCYVQHNEPQLGRDTLEVMDQNKVDCACVKGLECCGMPAWEHGDLESLRKHAKTNLEILMPYVDQGAKVLVINPTCAMLMRREYPTILKGEDRDRAQKLSEAIRNTTEYLWSLRGEKRFSREFPNPPPNPVAYHAPCHLRAQAVGFAGRDLLKQIPGLEIKMVMECCGHDGTYAMKTEGFEPSQKIGRKSFDGMLSGQTMATECPLAALQFQQHTGTKAQHPMSILAKAYRPKP